MEVKHYSQNGKSQETLQLEDAVFNRGWNGDLVHQVVVSMQANARANTAHAKDRTEVRGGGKKPWPQKGTGNARHGSIRSPIWVGGGIAHGPKNERNYTKKINAKMKKRALLSALSAKIRDGEVLFVERPSFEAPKTSQAKELLRGWSGALEAGGTLGEGRNGVKILMLEPEASVVKSFRNLSGVTVSDLTGVNVLDILSHKYLIIAGGKEAQEFLERKIARENARDEQSEEKK